VRVTWVNFADHVAGKSTFVGIGTEVGPTIGGEAVVGVGVGGSIRTEGEESTMLARTGKELTKKGLSEKRTKTATKEEFWLG